MNSITETASRRLWLAAGWLLMGYIVLTFAGVGFQPTLMLGDKPSVASTALVHSSMTKSFTGGYIEYLATLLFLLAALLIARLLRGEGVLGDWLSSCITAGAVIAAAVTVAVGFPAGAAAIYNGHHGASLPTVTAVNDIRNFAFFLTGGLYGVFALSVAVAARVTGRLPRWVTYTGVALGVVYLVAIPASRTAAMQFATLLGFIWLVALAVALLRQPRRASAGIAARRAMATA